MRNSLIISGLFGLASASPLALDNPSAAVPSMNSSLISCLTQKNVPTKEQSDSSFHSFAATFNTRVQYTPTVIVLPNNQLDISNAVTCASAAGIKVQAKSGGHSYASFSTGGSDGAMMIDLQNLQNVTLDSNGVATVGAGLRLGNLAQSIYSQGRRALAHGTCPDVGIGGHFTHGGFGYSSRNWGLSMDQIVGLDMVLANGSYVHASETSYPEIYWASRGAADSFGIVVNFYLQTHPAPDSIVTYTYAIPNMFDHPNKSAEYFQQMQNFVQNATVVDQQLSFRMYFDNWRQFNLEGSYFGSMNDFQSKVAPALLNGLPQPSWSNVKSVGWLDSLVIAAGTGSLSQPVHGYDVHENFYAKSVTVPEATPLTSAAMQSYFKYILDQGMNAPLKWFGIIHLYGGPNSQVNAKDTKFSAYRDRDSLWVAQHYGHKDIGEAFGDQDFAFMDDMNAALTSEMPNANFGAYINYVDPRLPVEQARDLYYGQELYGKLKSLKMVVDPGNMFSNPYSIQ